jgi:alkylhydroperoxidase/carboxymuconolactone decarboxylase family protein YurZ
MANGASDTPVLDLLSTMTEASIDATGLDAQTLMLVRFAALVAVDAPPASYLLNMGAASAVGLDAQSARDVLAAVAPIVGTARTVAALSKIVRALGLAIDLVELADESDEA